MSLDQQWAFAFVDLAGFSALTEAHGDALAAQQVRRFVEIAHTACNDETTLVKSMGDAVMLASVTIGSSLRAVAQLVRGCDRETNFPALRAGIHAGPAVHADGDFIGAAVNLAARVAAEAASGQVLATARIADAAADAGLATRPHGRTRLRNIAEAIDLYEILIIDTDPGLIDPICRMKLAPAAPAAWAKDQAGEWVAFCTPHCASVFLSRLDAHTEGGRL